MVDMLPNKATGQMDSSASPAAPVPKNKPVAPGPIFPAPNRKLPPPPPIPPELYKMLVMQEIVRNFLQAKQDAQQEFFQGMMELARSPNFSKWITKNYYW